MAAEQPAPSGPSLMQVVRSYAILVVLVILVQLVLSFFIIRAMILGRRQDARKEALAALEELKTPDEEGVVLPDKPAKIVEIKDDLLTNTADTDRIRFVKMHVHLGVTPEKASEEIALLEPKVIDTILGVIASKTVTELDDPADREVLKDEIKIAVNKYLRQGEVVKIYIAPFLIQ
jgi:flagellar FliL protein